MKAQAARGGSGTGSAHRRLHAACAVLILAAGTERTGDSEAGSLGSVLLTSRGKLAAGGQAGEAERLLYLMSDRTIYHCKPDRGGDVTLKSMGSVKTEAWEAEAWAPRPQAAYTGSLPACSPRPHCSSQMSAAVV